MKQRQAALGTNGCYWVSLEVISITLHHSNAHYLPSSSIVLVTQLCLTLATPWTVAYQTPLSMGLSRQEYWSGLPLPSPGVFPTQGSNAGLPHYRQILYRLSQGRSFFFSIPSIKLFILLVSIDFFLLSFYRMKLLHWCIKVLVGRTRLGPVAHNSNLAVDLLSKDRSVCVWVCVCVCFNWIWRS